VVWLQVTDWDRNRIDIEWAPPAKNGGAPIQKYIVQKKEKGSPHWVDVGTTPAGTTTFSAHGLQEGQDYEFRVIAVNDAGLSDPSEPSDPHTAKARFVKPQILTQNRKIKVRAGNPLNVPVEFVGAPEPTVDWTKEGSPVVTSSAGGVTGLLVDSRPAAGVTSLYFPSAKR